jgi:RNA polymerase sigma factor (TIGR02999 family)
MTGKSSGEGEARISDRARLDMVFQDHYPEIKRRIRQMLRRESHLTIQATEVLHEVYLNLARDPNLSYDEMRAVLSLIAVRTREYLVDRARRRNARKRGGDVLFVSLTAAENIGQEKPIDVLLLNEALSRLAAESPLAAEIAHLRWFVGLTEKEIAPLVGKGRSKVQRSWEFTKVWLADFLSSRSHSTEESHGE